MKDPSLVAGLFRVLKEHSESSGRESYAEEISQLAVFVQQAFRRCTTAHFVKLLDADGEIRRPANEPTPSALGGTPLRYSENRISQLETIRNMAGYLGNAVGCAKQLELPGESAQTRWEFIRGLISFAQMAQQMLADAQRTTSNARQRKNTSKRKSRANRRCHRHDDSHLPRFTLLAANHLARAAPPSA